MNLVLKINRFVVLYIFSAISLLCVVYIVPPIASYNLNSWAEFYRTLGKLLGIWGIIFGSAVIIFAGYSVINLLFSADTKILKLKFTKIEIILLGIFVSNIIGLFIGLARGESLTYVLGDTLKAAFIPLFYLWAKQNLRDIRQLIFFAKLVLFVESALFIIFAITSYIPFAQSTRTFLYTISFTLYFEERKILLKIGYFFVLAFALYIVITTQAFRGTVIVFILIVVLNILLRNNTKFSPLSIFAVLFSFLVIFFSINYFEVNLEKNISSVSKRFEATIEKSDKKHFGLEESVFQRVGETIDVIRTFQKNSIVFVLFGFGNGATLDNQLITPSELSVYKTKLKHNIYITLVGALYRYGIIGFFLYLFLFIYLVNSTWFYFKYRQKIKFKEEYLFLKVFTLYHLSLILYSFVAYLFIGNIVIAFTLPIHILLRQSMHNEVVASQKIL